jgi:hypothetical protein
MPISPRLVDTLNSQHVPPSQLAVAHERLGHFFLSQNDTTRAEAEFTEALRLSDGHHRSPAIFAQAGLAAIAISRHETSTALKTSSAAMNQLAHIEGNYDIRIQPQIWSIRAQSLMLAGEKAQALLLAERAKEAASLYYAPGSQQIAEATALFQDVTSANTTRDH